MFSVLYVIISCSSNIFPAQCEDGDVRLVDPEGKSDIRGRLELCLGQRWGTVYRGGWSTTDAQVVCNQLGFSSTGKGNAHQGHALVIRKTVVKEPQSHTLLEEEDQYS